MQVNMYGAANAARKRSAEQTAQQGDQGDTDEGNAAASHQLFYPQLGVKLCSMAGGGVQKIYMVFELGGEKPVAVYAYCNLHGLWMTKL